MITLFKQGKRKDQIQQWTIEVEGDSYRTVEGLVGGKLTTNAWTLCEGKNIGRANETSPQRQAELEALSKAQKKRDKGYVDDIADVCEHLEPTLAKVWEDYESKVTYPVYVSPKLDGIRCIATKEGLATRNGKPIVSCPHILEKLDEHFAAGGLPIDGELYNHELKHDFNTIVSLTKKQKTVEEDLAKSKELIQFHIFDIQAKEHSFPTRIQMLSWFDDCESIVRVSQQEAHSAEEVRKITEGFLNEGYEGSMVRWGDNLATYQYGRTKNLLKVKVFMSKEFPIVGIEEGRGKKAGTVGRYVIRLEDDTLNEVGPTGDEAINAYIFRHKHSIIGRYNLTVEFQGRTPDGKLRFPTAKGFRFPDGEEVDIYSQF